jgi:peptidoglycan/xylan/chitin deacetylase (PgdA/CDA1 family)
MRLNRFRERLSGRYRSASSKWLFRRPLTMRNAVPYISFTFDDFPRSALLTGGRILEGHGVAGTYYVSLGCVGQDSPSGELFVQRDFEDLVGRGHELGCHTYSHLNAWETSTRDFMKSIEQNQRALTGLVPGAEFKTLSYPVEYPRPFTKRRAGKEFLGCRGGGQRINHGTIDLNFMSAFFLDRRRDDLGRMRGLIDGNAEMRGWLIFGTHDVRKEPSPYGCTPDYFEEVVRYSIKSGAAIKPVAQVLESLLAAGGR